MSAPAPKLRLVYAAPEAPASKDTLPSKEARKREARLDDLELLRALDAGDQDAAASLCDRVAPVVAKTVGRMLGFGDRDFEDVVQQSMIQIVGSIERFRGDGPFDAWASTLAAHTTFKHLRRRSLERRVFPCLSIDEFAREPEGAPPSSVPHRDLLRKLRDVLSTIGHEKAWAYVLHDVYGYDLKEVSEITGASVAAAQTRLVRGRREFHQHIADNPELTAVLERFRGRPS